MIIVAGGDSFIWGNELADQRDGKYSLSTFPALLAKQIGAKYVCAAWPGNANNAISRMVINKCQQVKDCVVSVTWTFPHRYEFKFGFDTKQKISPWYSINAWDIADKETILAGLLNSDTSIIDHHLEKQMISEQTGLADFARNYFKYVGYNEYHSLYATLKEVLFLQNYLKINQIPYIFTTAENSFYQHPTYTRISDEYLANIYTQIDWNNWYFFPSKDTTVPRGFYQWALENKYKVATTHPLEESHEKAAILIKEKFDELIKKYSKSC